MLKFLDRVFLWLPNDHAPGVGAVGLFLLRQVTLPPLLMIGPFLAAGFAFPKVNWVGVVGGRPGAILLSMMGCVALVQELSRYAFVRHADRPLRSLGVFTAVTITLVTVMFHDHLYTVCWTIAAQLAASVAIIFGLRRREYIGFVIAAIAMGDLAVYVTAPQLYPLPVQTSAAKTEQPASTSPNPPAVGDMQSWAKLYPGAAIVESKSRTLFGLTDWRVTYRVQASPDQIETFYQTIATEHGFTDTHSMAGLHMFRQDGTNSEFSYAYAAPSDGAGAVVTFDARAFGR